MGNLVGRKNHVRAMCGPGGDMQYGKMIYDPMTGQQRPIDIVAPSREVGEELILILVHQLIHNPPKGRYNHETNTQ